MREEHEHRERLLIRLFGPLTIEGAAGPLSETLDLNTIDMRVGFGKIESRITGRAVGNDIALAITAPFRSAGRPAPAVG